MNKIHRLKGLKEYYTTRQMLLSFLTGFLFFLFPTILLTSLMVLSVLLSLYNLLYFLLGLYVLLVLLTFFTNSVILMTLKNYRDIPDLINYQKIYQKCSIISVISLALIFIGVTSIIYIYVM